AQAERGKEQEPEQDEADRAAGQVRLTEEAPDDLTLAIELHLENEYAVAAVRHRVQQMRLAREIFELDVRLARVRLERGHGTNREPSRPRIARRNEQRSLEMTRGVAFAAVVEIARVGVRSQQCFRDRFRLRQREICAETLGDDLLLLQKRGAGQRKHEDEHEDRHDRRLARQYRYYVLRLHCRSATSCVHAISATIQETGCKSRYSYSGKASRSLREFANAE